jgi:archaellum component FlaC
MDIVADEGDNRNDDRDEKRVAQPEETPVTSQGSVEQKLNSLLEFLQRSPALNGGFKKLIVDVDDIKSNQTQVTFELQRVHTKQTEMVTSIEDLTEAIYEPDSGLYRRISNNADGVRTHHEKLTDLDEQVEETVEVVQGLSKDNSTLKRIGGDDFEVFIDVVKKHKTTTKAWWLLVGAMFAGVGKVLFDLVSVAIQN